MICRFVTTIDIKTTLYVYIKGKYFPPYAQITGFSFQMFE